MCPWSLSMSFDSFQLHGKLTGFPKIASILKLDTKELKFNVLLLSGFARLETGVGIGKPLQVLISLDVTFTLLNMTEGLINSSALLENSMPNIFWKFS